MKKKQTLVPARGEMAWPSMRHLFEDMQNLFEDFRLGFPFRFAPTEIERVDWIPPIEVVEKNGLLTLQADLPGLTKDDVKVEITEAGVTITGARKGEQEEKGEGYFRSERTYGSFCRYLPLPEGAKTENATANFRNGVLEVVVPVPAVKEPKARRLEIKEAVTKPPVAA